MPTDKIVIQVEYINKFYTERLYYISYFKVINWREHFLMFSILKACSPELWSGYDKHKCGPCSALVKINRFHPRTCTTFCAAQNNMTCHNSWDDGSREGCGYSSRKKSCDHQWRGTSDAICECAITGSHFNDITIILYLFVYYTP